MKHSNCNRAPLASTASQQRREFRSRMLRAALTVVMLINSFPQYALSCGSPAPTNPNPGNNPPPCTTRCCKLSYGPTVTGNPVYLKYGTVAESVTDLSLPGPTFGWDMSRTYNSGGTGASSLGNLWLSGEADRYLIQSGANISLLISANSQRLFTGSGSPPTYTAPADSTLKLVRNSGNSEYILTDSTNRTRYTFHDFTVTTVVERGKLKSRSSLQWNSQGYFGLEYYYDGSGKLSQITTSDGQDYTIAFTYSGSAIAKVEIKDGSTVLQRVEYTYYQNVTSPSTDIGSTGDLVQVKVSRDASNDTPGTLSIIRYTQYRYGAGSKLKAIFDHDAILRTIASDGTLATPADVLKKADNFGTPDIVTFASRRFTYYTTNASTASIATPFNGGGENLNSLYGGGGGC